jgi:malonyl CoA-acyl carrier protein transacylase
MVELGADRLVEVGPGTTLTALASRIAPDLATQHIAAPGDLAVGAGAHP